MAKTIKRSFSGIREIPSDTFKLEVASLTKLISIANMDNVKTSIEHCHFFHTFDSDGKQMKESNAVAGHKHEVKIEYDEKKNIVSAECMPSMGHNHTLTYLKSDNVQVRIRNAEYAKMVAGFNNAVSE